MDSNKTDLWLNPPRPLEQVLAEFRAKHDLCPADHPARARLSLTIRRLETELMYRRKPQVN